MNMTEEEFKAAAEEKASGSVWYHRWFTTIIPCGASNTPTVINYCPNCRQTYSQIISSFHTKSVGESPTKAFITQLDLPREGCVTPQGVI